VFARPQYRWVTGKSLLQWLAEFMGRALDWLKRTQEGHPDAFKLMLVGMTVVLVAMLAHMAYVVWRITQPTARTPAGGAVGGALLSFAGASAHRERAEALARAGRYVEALAHRFVAVVLDLDQRQA
jgi:hypothetical protein